jgi:hypothetical protein
VNNSQHLLSTKGTDTQNKINTQTQKRNNAATTTTDGPTMTARLKGEEWAGLP